ncbi:hypothetical protein Tco_0255121, partial [Tanacetum coccineum]
KALISQGVANALAEIEANRTSRNGDDSHDAGTGSRKTERAARECTYTDFLKCQPLNFKGTKGVVGLTQWFEKMESVFHISNCTVACQIKFSTCTLQGNALTWWNSHVRTELALMCSRMFPEESNEVEKYAGGLPDMIQGSVMASKPKKMQDAIKFATELMDQKIRPGEKKPYRGSKHLCPKCNYYHDGQYAPKCANCKRIGHLTRDYRSPADATNNNQRASGANQRVLTCFECGAQDHFKSNCSKIKNKNEGNQAGNGNDVARLMVWALQGQTRTPVSFMSTTFSSLIDIIPTTLDYGYDIELADEIDSFDVIIGMDWLSKYHAVIVYDEKIIHIPFGDEILIVRGDGSNNKHESRLNVISCTKTQKYLLKGCHVCLAYVTAKKDEDKSEEKRLEDVPIV